MAHTVDPVTDSLRVLDAEPSDRTAAHGEPCLSGASGDCVVRGTTRLNGR